MKSLAVALPLALALSTLSATAGAVDVGQHPAVFSPRSLPGIDPSTFIVGHPAGGRGKAQPTANVPTRATAQVALPESLAKSVDQRPTDASLKRTSAL